MSGVKRKLSNYSTEYKYQALEEVDKGLKSKSEIARDLGIPQNTLSTWVKSADKIRENYHNQHFGPQRKRMRTAQFSDIEEALYKWFQTQRDKNLPVSGPMLQSKAEDLASKLGHPDFKCSNGWLCRFKSRHNIIYRSICGEDKAVTHTQTSDWTTKQLPALLSKFSPADIYNADETGIFYRLLPHKSLVSKGDPCHGGKQSKERLSVMVCSNQTGSDKIPLLVIGKSAKPRCFARAKTLPCQYQANKRAWFTQAIFTQWLQQLDRRFQCQKRSVLMIVDNCPAHNSVSGLKATTLVFLPPNTTSRTQPMDQGVIRNLKHHYRQLVLRRLTQCSDISDFKLNVLDSLHYLHQSWEKVTPSTISNCFRHCGFISPSSSDSSPVPDPDFSEEDDIPLSVLAKAGLSQESYNDYISADDNLSVAAAVTEDTIVEDVLQSRSTESPDPASDDDQDCDPEPPKPPSTSAALLMCTNLRTYLQSVTGSEDCFLYLAKVEEFVQQCEEQKKTQRSITDFLKM